MWVDDGWDEENGGWGRKMILNTPCCGNASAILTLDAAPKKGDHIYTPTVRTRRRISCRPRNYASSTERGSRKKITWSSGETRGESADRIVDGG